VKRKGLEVALFSQPSGRVDSAGFAGVFVAQIVTSVGPWGDENIFY
jgi:hypothetical protein